MISVFLSFLSNISSSSFSAEYFPSPFRLLASVFRRRPSRPLRYLCARICSILFFLVLPFVNSKSVLRPRSYFANYSFKLRCRSLYRLILDSLSTSSLTRCASNLALSFSFSLWSRDSKSSLSFSGSSPLVIRSL
jgi:hypothetical protein